MNFQPNRRFRKKYNQIFRDNPEAANLFLLLCELADKEGRIVADEAELAKLMTVRFGNPREYQL